LKSRILGVLPALLLAACFDPSFNNPTCGPAGECPEGYDCMAGVCRLPVVIEPDADPNAPDASLIDADPNAPDARILVDAPILAGCAGWTFAPSNVACIDPIGTWDLTTSTSYNTDTGMVSTGAAPVSSLVSQTGGGNVRVVSVTSFSVGSGTSLRITGSLPLIVLVHGDATVVGMIDSSADFEVPGPGGNANECGTQLGNGESGLVGGTTGGGGGGASFGGGGRPGGNGGAGAAGGGNSGNVATSFTLAPLRGGCRGGSGGNGTAPAGVGGAGGGAIEIAARDQIIVTGMVHGGGGGGRGATGGGVGGGGGGSGGAVLLEAPGVSVMGSLCANSGAAAGGAGQTAAGVAGQDASCTSAAVGGSGATNAGDGGNGTHLATMPGNGTSGSGSGTGGGGGGGGAGVIRVRGALTATGATISPAPTTVPL